MIACTAASTSNDENVDLPGTFIHFVNCDNVGMAQYNLVHQFKEQGFPDVPFALDTTHALFIGEFLYCDSSTPSNFTIFAFHEQEPNSNNCQQDCLICHILQIDRQKKSLEEIKALLKQAVHIPSNYNGLGTQIQIFAAASSILFVANSMCTYSLWQLLLLVSWNKKSFRDRIALN
jgi:hypothetical protein